MEKPEDDAFDNVWQSGLAFMGWAGKIGEHAMKAQTQLFTQQVKLLEKFVVAGNRHMELVRDIRDPADYFVKASAVTFQLSQDVAGIVREAIELQVEVGGAMARTIADEVSKGFSAWSGIAAPPR